MAHSKSSKKRIEIAKRNRAHNRFYKNSTRTFIKKFFLALESYKLSKSLEEKEKVEKLLASIYSLLDKASRQRIVHPHQAARKKSQLAAHFRQA